MIYLDSAATTLQKPPEVLRAAAQALVTCANPGRSGHKPALKAAEIVYDCRVAAAEFFGMDAPERVVFTHNATHALNIAIKSTLHNGGHAVISGYEHNSVVRPLEAFRERGVSYTAAHSALFSPEDVCRQIRNSLRPDTVCVILNHVSNVFGFVLPVKKIDDLCHERGIPLILDASQSAGTQPLNVKDLRSTAFVCMPGHKGLYGPQGTGILLCCKADTHYSLIEGGTGSLSMELTQPTFLPDGLESGTLNVPGIAGLREGLRFVQRHREEIRQRETALVRKAAEGLGSLHGTEVFFDSACQGGVLSFRTEKTDTSDLCQKLADRGICARAGLHCAPLAHKSAGTLPDGTVRISFSAFNTERECERFLKTANDFLKSR